MTLSRKVEQKRRMGFEFLLEFSRQKDFDSDSLCALSFNNLYSSADGSMMRINYFTDEPFRSSFFAETDGLMSYLMENFG